MHSNSTHSATDYPFFLFKQSSQKIFFLHAPLISSFLPKSRSTICEVQDKGPRMDEISILAKEAMLGNRSAETKLLMKCQPIAQAQLRRFAKQAADVDDLTQEAMMVLLDHIRNRKLRKPESIRAYVKSIAKNQFYMECRKSKRFEEMVFQTVAQSALGTACPMQKQLDFQQSLISAWQKLKIKRDKSVLIDILTTNATKKELVDKYNVKPAQFDRITHRARRRFQNAWDQQDYRDMPIV